MSCHIELPEEGLTLTSSYAKLQVGASRDIYEESGGPDWSSPKKTLALELVAFKR